MKNPFNKKAIEIEEKTIGKKVGEAAVSAIMVFIFFNTTINAVSFIKKIISTSVEDEKLAEGLAVENEKLAEKLKELFPNKDAEVKVTVED